MRWAFTASGPVTNIAAIISALASEGAILAGHETYRRVRRSFKLKPVGRQRLKNVPDPVLVYRVV